MLIDPIALLTSAGVACVPTTRPLASTAVGTLAASVAQPGSVTELYSLNSLAVTFAPLRLFAIAMTALADAVICSTVRDICCSLFPAGNEDCRAVGGKRRDPGVGGCVGDGGRVCAQRGRSCAGRVGAREFH